MKKRWQVVIRDVNRVVVRCDPFVLRFNAERQARRDNAYARNVVAPIVAIAPVPDQLYYATVERVPA